MTATKDNEERPKYHSQFSSSDADTILVSSEDTMYRIPSFTLRNTCGLFRTLAAPAQQLVQSDKDTSVPIEVAEKDKVLAKVLSMICGLHTENWESIGEVEDALSLVQKWDAPGPLSIIRGAITAPVFLAEPLRLYALATRFGWEEEAQLASTHTLAMNLYGDEHRASLERVSSHHLLVLLRFHRRRRDEFKNMVDGEGMFEAGNATRYLCVGCTKEVSNHTWREFKSRMFCEMDRRPLGDTLVGLEMEEWAEATACWSAKCRKTDCGRVQYNKLDTLRDIKKCIDRLPLHI